MTDIYHCGYHLFTTTSLQLIMQQIFFYVKRTFIVGTLHRGQLKHLSKDFVGATSRMGQKIYYSKGNFFAMSYKQKKNQTKPVIMLSAFVGAYDVAHRKYVSKSVPPIATNIWEGLTRVTRSCLSRWTKIITVDKGCNF